MFGKLKFLVMAAVAASGAAVVVSASAANPNLLVNGAFKTSVLGWEAADAPPAAIVWDDGTMKVINLSTPGVTAQAWAIQCVGGISAGTQYVLNADVYYPSGQGRQGGGGTRIFWYPNGTCTGPLPSGPMGTFVTKQDKWTKISDDFVAPVGAKSARVMLMTTMYALTPGDKNPFAHLYTKWDNAYFGEKAAAPSPTPTNTPATPAVTVTPPAVTATPTATPPAATSTPTPPESTATSATPAPPATPGSQLADSPNQQQDASAGNNGQAAGDSPGTMPHGSQATGENGTPSVEPPAGQPLPPETGNGIYEGDGLIGRTGLAIAVVGLMALTGLILATVAAVRSRREES